MKEETSPHALLGPALRRGPGPCPWGPNRLQATFAVVPRRASAVWKRADWPFWYMFWWMCGYPFLFGLFRRRPEISRRHRGFIWVISPAPFTDCSGQIPRQSMHARRYGAGTLVLYTVGTALVHLQRIIPFGRASHLVVTFWRRRGQDLLRPLLAPKAPKADGPPPERGKRGLYMLSF
jgi:hypothetical protein